MKAGMTLAALAAEITRQQKVKHDYKAPTNLIQVEAHRSSADEPLAHLTLNLAGRDEQGPTRVDLEMNDIFHDQLGVWAGIPSKYYNRMRAEAPALLANNANYWLRQKPETRLVRTLDGRARAFLSNRYRTIDNADVAEAVLPIILEQGGAHGLRVESCIVTERQLMIKCVSERIQGTILGEQVQSGVVISNSEVGLHSFRVEPLIFVLSCLNGAVMQDAGMRRYHIGRTAGELEGAVEVFQDETRKADDRVLMMKMRDVVGASFEQMQFTQMTKGLEVQGRKVVRKALPEVAQSIVEVFSLPEKWQGGILERLATHDRTAWGISNALTLFAQAEEHTYEEATDLERLGGEVLTLPEAKWEQISAQ